MLQGTVVQNSLNDDQILQKLHIGKTWKEGNWILHDVHIDEKQANEMGKYLVEGPWYMHFWDPNKDEVLVVFKNKNFTISRIDKSTWSEAVKYGESIGIPEEQLDFLT